MRLDHEVIVVGAGFGGIGVGIELKRIGIENFVLLEEAGDLGGTWRDNTYPGLEVDIPSFSFSYSFEPYREWSRIYAPGREVKEYADYCADKYRIRPHIRYQACVEEAVWEDADRCWRVRIADGRELRARFLVSACGFLVRPRMPEIAGIDEFRGKLIHTSRWDHDYDLTGKRVAMIGTGATAIQVGPAIVDHVARLDVYQRTPIWLLPKYNPILSERARRVFRRAPGLQKLLRTVNWGFMELFFSTSWLNHHRFAWLHTKIENALVARMRRQVRDTKLQEKLIPPYSFFCKRPSFSNTFYPMLSRDDVELVTEPIGRFTETGIETEEGAHREVDAVICATGFKYFQRSSTPTFEVWGRARKNLGDWWQKERYQAFHGTTMPDFPNLFMLVGPYAASGVSYFDTLGNQVAQISRCLRAARRRSATRVEVRREAQERDLAFVLRRRGNTVMFHGDCSASNSYYFDSKGDSPAIRPCSPSEEWLKSRLLSVRRNYHID